MSTRLSCFLVASFLGVVACTPVSTGSLPPLPDAAADTSIDSAPTDAPPADAPLADGGGGPDVQSTACASDRDCSAEGLVCDLDSERCVQCNTQSDCTAGLTCLRNACVATVACTSSRMCPGQVCSARLGFCVDCEADNDCPADQRCQSAVCVPRPTPCGSDRDCSAMGQVCDPAARVCVECAADTDCPSGRWCTTERACRRQACTPNETSCQDLTRQRTCDARGTGLTVTTCPTGQTCRESRCQPTACTPGTMRCEASTKVREVCDASGAGFALSPCPSGQSCSAGNCVAQVCTPGEASCTSAGQRRVCNTDALTYAVSACPSGQSCSMGACVAQVCTPGAATCTSPTSRQVCASDGLSYTTMDCGSMQRCSDGRCLALACMPGTSTCVSATTVRLCSADGLTAMTMTCPSGSTCSGTSCTGWVCTPGEASCASSMVRSVCNADGLARTTTACPTPMNASSATCAMGACGFTCVAGYGDCNSNTADGCETVTATSVAHCGACGNACPTRLHVLSTCAAGACGFGACEAGYADCDGDSANGCETDTRWSVAHCGGCGRACPTRQACSAGACTAEPTLHITAFNATNCRVVDHSTLTGDDRGGVVVSASRLFVSGDTATGRLDVNTLDDQGRTPARLLSPFQDVASGQIYVLLNAAGAQLDGAGTITQFAPVDGTTGEVGAARIPLSTPITEVYGTGIFSGPGRLLLHNGTRWYEVLLPSGVVTELATAPAPSHRICEAWAWWGVAEYFGGDLYATYAQTMTTIVRYRVRDATVTTVSTFTNLSDTCSIAVSPSTRRWYFHHEYSSQFGGLGSGETAGYCDATFE